MKQYDVKKPVTLTAQPGSVVILTDQQAEAVRDFVTEAADKKPGRRPAATEE